MRILLAQNSLYYPAHGGGDKSNRLLLEALAARGHECRAVARIPVFGPAEHERYLEQLAARGVAPSSADNGIVEFTRAGVEVHVATNANLRAHFGQQVNGFRPDVILASTDDPAQLLLEVALRSPARVAYLARAPLALPFGPDCAFPSEAKATRLRAADVAVGVSEYVARYLRQYGGVDAVHVPISLLEPEDWPFLGRFDNQFVTMTNPCTVKGIDIFLALADAFPEMAFAAVPVWGTTSSDRAELARRPNIRLLDPVDDINLLLARTRALLVPSLWAEARSRIVVEAMLRGVPVLASDVGGIPEAKMGTPYLLPVNPIVRYHSRLDEQMVPVAEAPPQDIAPWREALGDLLCDRAHYDEVARLSREAALAYARNLGVEPFEALLTEALGRPKRRFLQRQVQTGASEPVKGAQAPLENLSAEKRKLLGVILRKRAPSAAWFPGAEAAGSAPTLFCFPYAGGGAAAYAGWRLPERPGFSAFAVCPVRLPGRESRAAEEPFDAMPALVQALTAAIEPLLDRPFAFFGHSMGAAVAFELARALRKRGAPMPAVLIASGARAPQFRRNWTPPPEPPDEALKEELQRLQGAPDEALDDPALLGAILPVLRADTRLYRNYIYGEDEPLDFPIRAYGGAEDPNITRDHLEGWSEQTLRSFAVRIFPGGHFFLHASRAQLLDALSDDLESLC